MCRSIKPLFNFDPPATDAEIRAAALQFVRKISGFGKPSKVNQDAFDKAVDEIAAASTRLVGELKTPVPAKHRAEAVNASASKSGT
jgi:hypothetical protein